MTLDLTDEGTIPSNDSNTFFVESNSYVLFMTGD